MSAMRDAGANSRQEPSVRKTVKPSIVEKRICAAEGARASDNAFELKHTRHQVLNILERHPNGRSCRARPGMIADLVHQSSVHVPRGMQLK